MTTTMEHYKHFQEFLQERGYNESLTDQQQAAAYSQAYPGRTIPLISEMAKTLRSGCLASSEREFWFDHQNEIINFVSGGVRPENPLVRAILKNDLKGAARHADGELGHHLCDIVRTLIIWLPPVCWGSPEAVATWTGPEAAELRHTVLSQSESQGWHEWTRLITGKP